MCSILARVKERDRTNFRFPQNHPVANEALTKLVERFAELRHAASGFSLGLPSNGV